MATIVFVAVQCFECSTMQVKQQKKSSNRWRCAVCNQKQSLRKVFARGFMAKEVRMFVQSFNMSRKFVEEGKQLTANCEVPFSELDDPSAEIGKEEEQKKKKRRVDWSEYMEGDDLHGDEFGTGLEGGEVEPNIVTEWPEELLKKPKLKSRAFSHVQCEAAHKPVFSKRNRNLNSQEKEMGSLPRKSMERSTEEKSINENDNPFGNPKERQITTKYVASKWDEYMEGNDDGHCCRERKHDLPAADDLDCRYEYDQEVEEDIHPDFL